MSNQHWGALPHEWPHWDLVLGLGEDLQPSVCKPGLLISPNSDLREGYSKVPSLITSKGTVCGISGWGQKHATPEQLEGWAKNPDYGICLITRHVRAFDVDVVGVLVAAAIRHELEKFFGMPLFYRSRADSPKFLVPFICPGDFAKRVMPVEHGIIEWLATGQQFLAAGTHKDGARYDWLPSLPLSFPEKTLEETDRFWETVLGQAFATEPLKPRRRMRRTHESQKVANSATSDDPVAEFLVRQEKVLDTTEDGKLYIPCPWKDQHTSESGMTETAYFPAGTGGYETGHFVCLHAHCEGRTDAEFLAAIGYAADEFEMVPGPIGEKQNALQHEPGPPVPIDPNSPLDLPNFERQPNSFKIKATLNNLMLALARPDLTGITIRYDVFRDELCYERGDGSRRPFMDPDYTALRVKLESGSSGFMSIQHEMIQKAVHLAARSVCFDSAGECFLDNLSTEDLL